MPLETRRRRRVSLHTKILLGFVLGAILGLVTNRLVLGGVLTESQLESFIENVTAPLGRIFLNLLFMVVVPIVFCSIALGVAQLGDVKRLGRLGSKTLGYFVFTSAVAAALGLLLVNLVRPGEGFDPETQARLTEQYRAEAEVRQTQAEQQRFWPDIVVGVVSPNPFRDAVELNMLPIIFFSLIFGVALTRLPAGKARAVSEVLDGVGSAMVVLVGFAMSFAPLAVPALAFDVTARFGWSIFRQLGLFVGVVGVGYLLHQFVIYGLLVRFLARMSPRTFFRKTIPVMVTAIATSSSAATLPTTIKITEEELGVPSRLAGFVLPLGATVNMNGTSLFVTVVVLFLAQVFGVIMSPSSQLMVVVFAVLTAVGAAGVPSGSLPVIIVVLTHFGIPGEGLAIVLGVDRLLDMGRTVVNVSGDVTAACFVAASERRVASTPESYPSASASETASS